MNARTGLLFATLALAAACSGGPTDRERVQARVEAVRVQPTSAVEERRRATEDLAAVDVADPVARTARDHCATAYRASTDLFEALAELEHLTKSGRAKEEEARARDLVRRSEELHRASEEALPRCNDALSKL